jgi:DNA-binding LacI/PurR family transcriptional regulator
MCPDRLPVVRLDVERGVDLALDHLLELGHTRIAHLASSFDAPTFDLRRDRLRRRLGHEPPSTTAPFTFEGAAAAAGPLLDQGGFTAIFCDDDILAGGVYLAARERGISIPGDLSVIGFDDIMLAAHVQPGLTTLRQNKAGLGAAAARALLDRISRLADPPPVVTLPVELVERGSTAPPRANRD